MNDFQKHKEALLNNPEFRQEYEALQPEYEVIRALIRARMSQQLTQAQLAERSGIRQSNISRIESGSCSPTIATLQQLAAGMGMQLHLSFTPVRNQQA